MARCARSDHCGTARGIRSGTNEVPTHATIRQRRGSGASIGRGAVDAARVRVPFHAMGELKDQIRTDLKNSMKAKDTVRTGTLRMVLSALQAEEVAGKEARTLTDDEVLKIIAKESKKRLEAAQVFDDAGRSELAQKERAEEEILSGYLPEQLSDDEVSALVDGAIAEVREQAGEDPGMRQMGQVMKAATARAAGRADGARLSAVVKSRLAQ